MKLSKLSIPYRAFKTAGSILAIGVFSSLEAASLAPGYFLAMSSLFLFGSILVSFWFYLVWKNFEFEITEDTFDIRSGVVQKKRREIPLHRIQNVDVRRNIFQRALGIAKVSLETAGGQTSEASLKYVELEKAQSIQERVRRLKQKDLTVEESSKESPLFELSEKELGILSITSLNMAAISAIAVAFSFFGFAGQAVEGAFNTVGIIVLGFLLVGVVLLGVLVSAASNINKFYGFKLYRQGDSLEYERGLLNRSEGSIPFEKIQNLRVEENPLKRLFGYSTLKVETAGYSGQGQDQQGPEVAVPLAERSHVLELSNHIFDHGEYSIQKVSKNAFRRYFGRYMLISLIPVAGILTASKVFNLSFNPAFVFFLIPLIGFASYLKYVNKGFYEGKEFFYTQNGFWNRKTNITPYYRVQNLSLSQTVFQKRLNTSTLILDTAGIYTFSSNPRAVDIDDEVGEALFERVFQSFKDSSKK